MRDPLKRLIALVLCLALMICLVPPVAGADEAEEEVKRLRKLLEQKG